MFTAFATAQLKTEAEYLNIDGIERYYELFVPKNYSEKTKLPVLLVLHGGGGKAKGMIRHTKGRFNQLASREGFIVVYPNGFEKGWNDGARDTLAAARRLKVKDVEFFEAMIDDLDKKLSIDRENIFVCGISNGGFMAQRLAFELSDKIKGIAVVAANLSVDQSLKPYPPEPTSALFICGTHDPLVPYNGGHVKVFNQKRGEVLSVAETVEAWKLINKSAEQTEVFSFPDISKRDKCSATKTVWHNANNSKLKVVDIKIENGGHTWPGTSPYLPKRIIGNTNYDFNACDEIWLFFSSLM